MSLRIGMARGSPAHAGIDHRVFVTVVAVPVHRQSPSPIPGRPPITSPDVVPPACYNIKQMFGPRPALRTSGRYNIKQCIAG